MALLMLLKLIKSLISRNKGELREPEVMSKLAAAQIAFGSGDFLSAIPLYREYLEGAPFDIVAMNDLGCCLSNSGDDVGAAAIFERAFSINDAYLPVVVNYAKSISDRQRSEEALSLLKQAVIYDSDFYASDAVLGAIALSRGDAGLACWRSKRAWLASFDNLRLANCYLLNCAYHDIDEGLLAAEHLFWAETLAPRKVQVGREKEKGGGAVPSKSAEKFRIGYWSPDFRNHSVRYFFRPLLENHDRDRFEIFLYHDIPKSDEQTKLIKDKSDRFFDVSQLPDADLVELMKSHQLDVLVELAGHTSNNRLHLLQERLATIQLTGIGYPPTTGLCSVDAKFMDEHMVDENSKSYCVERPLILASSFWCFDPMEDAEIDPESPLTRKGYPTFGCVGNIAKISDRVLKCWAQIMYRIANARLILRSISFNDPASVEAMRLRIEGAGVDPERVDFLGPAGGGDYFASYNDIDIILDTYPFNGGTTSCFAVYMGVPVVSLSGKSLISRMGKSILGNLEMSDCVVDNDEDYIERAIALASDASLLARFRREARERLARTALGNGKIFSRELETAYVNCLIARKKEADGYVHAVRPLPAQELVRRAYSVLRKGQFDAAQRIVNYCLREYPCCGVAHVLNTQRLTAAGKYREAANYLLDKMEVVAAEDRFALFVNIIRFLLVIGQVDESRKMLDRARAALGDDSDDLLQLGMLEQCIAVREGVGYEDGGAQTGGGQMRRIIVLIVADDEMTFSHLKKSMFDRCLVPDGVVVTYLKCPEQKKGKVYRSALSDEDKDIVLVVHRNVQVCSKSFFYDVISALENCDVVGVAGARNWDRLDWRKSRIGNKAACFMVPSGEVEGQYELHKFGLNVESLVGSLSILDGSLLAINRGRISAVSDLMSFDSLLEDGAALMEEEFTHRCHLHGLRLAVHQCLGVLLDWRIGLRNEHLGEVRWQLVTKYDFDPLEVRDEDHTIFSVPVASVDEGVAVQRAFIGRAKCRPA